MKQFLIVVGVVCGLFARPAAGAPLGFDPEMSADEMIRLFRNEDVRAVFFLVGVAAAYNWANARLKVDGKTPLFCRHDIVLTAKKEVGIMVLHIAQAPESGKLPAGGVMLAALQEAFPCKP